MDGQTTAAQAMNADLSAQVGILRGDLPIGVSPGDRLVGIEVDLALLEGVVGMFDVGVRQAEKFTKRAFLVDPADTVIAERGDVVAAVAFFAGAIAADGDVFEYRNGFLSLAYFHILLLSIN